MPLELKDRVQSNLPGRVAKKYGGDKAAETRAANPTSWKNVIKRITSMTVEDIAAEFGEQVAAMFPSDPKAKTKTLRELMVLEAVKDFFGKPSSSMWNILMEREEGKVPNQIQGSMDYNIYDWRELAEKLGVTEEEALKEAERIVNELNAGPK